MERIDVKGNPELLVLNAASATDMMPDRPEDCNKCDFGRLLVIAGSKGMPGAAYLCAKGAFRAGVGLVYEVGPVDIRHIFSVLLPEAIYLEIDTEPGTEIERIIFKYNPDCIALGPGISTDSIAVDIVRSILNVTDRKIVIDADALNIISGYNTYDGSDCLQLLKESAKRNTIIITPHPGEMARLMRKTTIEIQEDRIGNAKKFAKLYGTITVLKGSKTITAIPCGRVYINPTGNAGMATAGAGDVLTGIIGGLAAQGMSPGNAAAAGVFMHGLAGDIAMEKIGMQSMMAGDIIDYLPSAFAILQKKG